MAKTMTIQSVKDDLSRNGRCIVPFATLEYVLGEECTDDDTFDATISAFVSSKDWLTAYEVDWIKREVHFSGPWTEPGDDV